jgi:hypothetical protein
MRDSDVSEATLETNKTAIEFSSALNEIDKVRQEIESGIDLEKNITLIRGQINICVAANSKFSDDDLRKKMKFLNMQDKSKGADNILKEILRTPDPQLRKDMLNGIVRLLR